MEQKNFGLRLKKYREQNKLSIEKFAEAADISIDHARKLEAGKVLPPLDMLMKLAKTLKITPNCLIYNDSVIEPEFLKTISNYNAKTLSDSQLHLLKTAIDSVSANIMDKSRNTVGYRIEKARKAKGLSCSELSRRLGTSGGYIRNIEVGTDNPSVTMLEKICELLEIDVNYLICDNSRETELYVLNDLMLHLDKNLSPQDAEFMKLLYNYIIGGFAANDENR